MLPYISTSNSKLGNTIPSINLPPIITCRDDAPCKKQCYATRGNFCYKNVKNSLDKNLESYLNDSLSYFDTISLTLRQIPYRFFRFHSTGDIVDDEYFVGMCKIARKHTNTQFLCFTKKYEIVNKYIESNHRIPKNLVIVLSVWGSSFIPENPYNLPTAHVKLKKENCMIPSKANECSGFCGSCCDTENSCWKLKRGESVVFTQH